VTAWAEAEPSLSPVKPLAPRLSIAAPPLRPSDLPSSQRHTARRALDAARDHLLELQDPQGWWKAELETNVTMDAEDLLLRHFLGILTGETAGAAGRWIASQQGPDGAWGSFYGGPANLSATVEAYVGLRLAGHPSDAPHMAAAATWVRAHGGIEGTRVFTRIWLAMLGHGDWDLLPVLPPEIMFLPARVPLNIYDFGCWARQTIVALSVVFAHRPSRPLPFGLDELHAPPGPPAPAGGWRARAFQHLDRVLHRYEKLPRWFFPRNILRRAALSSAERWILRRQEADGCWGGIQPPLVYSLIALHLQGYPLDHPVMAAALHGMDRFLIDDERGRRVEACQSPVWDTALAMVALADAGVAPDHPALERATEWLVGEEVRVKGDWSVRRPHLAPGGWAFEFANVNYPDTDDTAEVILALRRAGVPGAVRAGIPGAARAVGGLTAVGAAPTGGLFDEAAAACRRGVRWTVGMQSSDGGWAAFDVDNTSALVKALPFCDFGEVIDPPSADVTAHVIEMLAAEPAVPPVVMRRGVQWLWDHQEADGSWFGRWGVNHIYCTGAVVPALITAGVPASDRRLRRAARWLVEHQNPDGGWGEDIRSYRDQSWRGHGTSTASQTAWALLALLALGEQHGEHREAVLAGVQFLVDTQTPDGTWDEPQFTGTGFPWDFSINYHLYRLVFPLSALGRFVAATSPGEAP
jgi:squalene-hopene/tetraprenyl-beta-curcumene cyclase